MAHLGLDGLPGNVLAQRWGVPQVGLFRRLGSTLDAIHDLGAQDAPHGTVVLAEEQTAGRGRDGRTWRSPAGGVWLGMLLRPGDVRVEPGSLAIRAGLVLADAVDEVVGRPVAQLKWPNDVLVQDRKLAGILCESRWQGEALQWIAVGLGVNLGNELPPELGARAVALREVAPAVRRIDLLDRLVPALARIGGPGAFLAEAECAAFAARDWLHGRMLRSPAAGLARGIRPDGALLVDAGAGTVGVREGHVELA